jgi:hypothetical protein
MNKISPPETTTGDRVHAITKGVISAVPWLGGVGSELFQIAIQPPLERRKEKWMDDIATKLQELESSGVCVERLSENEEFVSTVMHASQIAIRTHTEEKLVALRNATLNVAIGQAPDSALQAIFLNYVDMFCDWHILILKLFQSPPPSELSAGALENVLIKAYPVLSGNRAFYDTMWRDLFQRGLVNTESLHSTMSAIGLSQRKTSEHGDKFLSFINEPHA